MKGLDVRLSMDTPADSFELMLRPNQSNSQINRNDPITVDLGYDSNHTSVFSGVVDAIEVSISVLRILGLSQMVKLLKLRISQTYIKQTAGDIVKDLCGKAQVAVGDIQDGVSLPSFFVSHEVPAYDYVKSLAERSSFDLYFTPTNSLAFKEYKPQTNHDLVFGQDALTVDAVQLAPAEGVRVFGESPSSSKGSDTSHWLTKEDVEGIAGTGQSLLILDPAVRDKATADAVAKSRLTQARQALFVSILALGDPEIKLGDSVTLKGFDHDLLKGGFKVRTVEHSLTKGVGFTSRIVCSREV